MVPKLREVQFYMHGCLENVMEGSCMFHEQFQFSPTGLTIHTFCALHVCHLQVAWRPIFTTRLSSSTVAYLRQTLLFFGA